MQNFATYCPINIAVLVRGVLVLCTCLISGGAGISGAKSSRSSGSLPTASSSSVKVSSCSQSSPKGRKLNNKESLVPDFRKH